jgi:hypothetical protein
MRFYSLALLGAFAILPRQASAAGKPFNPDISVNFLGLAQYGTAYSSSRTVKPHDGLQLQEAEMQFLSDVDPYFRANALFSISQEDGKSSYAIDPEEVFLETISLPYVTVKAGKFKMALGKHNQLHTHAFPFIDQPLIISRLLGDEGLNENGVSVSGLLPFIPWFSELTLQGMSLGNDQLFASKASGDLGYLARFKNLWEISDSTTIELGVSGVQGNNQFARKSTVLGSDLTVKWRPTDGGKYHALVWSTEYLDGQRIGKTADRDVANPTNPATTVTITEGVARLGGIASWVQYQMAERWWLQGRYEYVGLPQSRPLNAAAKESALVAFFPSEFSGLRLQYDWIQDTARPRKDHSIAFQYNVTIGAHPAHSY